MPFKIGGFDVVLCINVLDHTEKPELVLEQIKNCLKEGGKLLFSVDTYELPKFLRCGVLGKFDSPHPHHFTISEVCKLLKQSGFRIDYSHFSGKEWIAEFKDGLIVKRLKKSALKFLVAKMFFAATICLF